jgi:hypothetical protein
VTLAEQAVMSALEAAQARSSDPAQPLVIPALYAALRAGRFHSRAAHGSPDIH